MFDWSAGGNGGHCIDTQLVFVFVIGAGGVGASDPIIISELRDREEEDEGRTGTIKPKHDAGASTDKDYPHYQSNVRVSM